MLVAAIKFSVNFSGDAIVGGDAMIYNSFAPTGTDLIWARHTRPLTGLELSGSGASMELALSRFTDSQYCIGLLNSRHEHAPD